MAPCKGIRIEGSENKYNKTNIIYTKISPAVYYFKIENPQIAWVEINFTHIVIQLQKNKSNIFKLPWPITHCSIVRNIQRNGGPLNFKQIICWQCWVYQLIECSNSTVILPSIKVIHYYNTPLQLCWIY